METEMPHRIFTDEWDTLKKDPIKRWRPRYAELGTVERVVPWVFVAIYMLIAVVDYIG